MKIVFNIDPVPASRPRVTQWGTYYGEKYSQYRKDMGKLLLGVKRYLLEQPLKTDVTFFIGVPKSYSQKKKDAMDGTRCVSNMDLDNLEKAVYDCLNGHVYVDDKQIVEHTTRKIWVKENPRTEITIERI